MLPYEYLAAMCLAIVLILLLAIVLIGGVLHDARRRRAFRSTCHSSVRWSA